jgi:hypothetical protein
MCRAGERTVTDQTSEDRAAQIVASIDHHYRVTGFLNGQQLAEHKRRLACPACATASPAVTAQVSADA